MSSRTGLRSLSALRGQCVVPSKLRGAPSTPYASMLDLMGSTPVLSAAPLVEQMQSLAHRPEIMCKLESTNPGWSVKARPAINMIEQAEARGDIGPNTSIIESSSGNTAIAIAMVAAIKGYHFMPVVDVKMPKGKLDLLRIFGADVQLVGDPNIPPEEQSMVELKIERRATVERLVNELGKNAFSPNQYANPDNAGAHMLSTGPELLEQVGADLDALLIPMSTGGQIDGIGRFMKEHLPNLRLIGVEPIGSTILAQQEAGDYYNAGSGLDYTPTPVGRMLHDGLVDDVMVVPDYDSFRASRILAKTTGALLGPSTGMQMFAALSLAQARPDLKRIAMVACDDGRAYVPDMMDAKAAEGATDSIEEFEAHLARYAEERAATPAWVKPPAAVGSADSTEDYEEEAAAAA